MLVAQRSILAAAVRMVYRPAVQTLFASAMVRARWGSSTVIRWYIAQSTTRRE